MGKWGESEEEDSGELGDDGAAGGAGRSKYCVWLRFPDGVMDHEWGPGEVPRGIHAPADHTINPSSTPGLQPIVFDADIRIAATITARPADYAIKCIEAHKYIPLYGGWGCRRRSNSFFFILSFLSHKKCSEIYPLCDGDGILPPGSPVGV